MSLEAEILADRRQLKRKATFWRRGAIALLVMLVLTAVVKNGDVGSTVLQKEHIARVDISGVITDDRDEHKMLKKLAKSKKVKAVVLRINSPGGTTTGGEALYETLLELKKKKPVVAVFGTVAASAAYMAAMAADRVFARTNTITGSVGVIFQWAEVSDLLKTVGVKVQEIKSGPLKATPSPFRPADEEGLRVAREMVDESFEWFVGVVAKGRGVEPADVPGLRDGRVYSGRKALELKLIDEIGGEDEAIAWLESKRDIEKKLPVRDWEPEKESNLSLLTGLIRGVGHVTGLDSEGLLQALTLNEVRGRLELTGLVSLWRPPATGR